MLNQRDAYYPCKWMLDPGNSPYPAIKSEEYRGVTQEELNKYLKFLSMDAGSSSAPGLLSELNDALKELDQIRVEILKAAAKTEELHCLEVKEILLLMYCQYIAFYLLLKSEGKPVRDHPVIARLVETKSLLGKTKVLDGYLPSLDVLFADNEVDCKQPAAVKQKAPKQESVSSQGVKMLSARAALERKLKQLQSSRQKAVSSQSAKMFCARAVFEEKMKQQLESSRQKTKKQLESSRQKTKKHTLQTYNSRFETLDDFGDDDVDVDASAATLSEKISQVLNMNKERNKKGYQAMKICHREKVLEKDKKDGGRIRFGPFLELELIQLKVVTLKMMVKMQQRAEAWLSHQNTKK